MAEELSLFLPLEFLNSAKRHARVGQQWPTLWRCRTNASWSQLCSMQEKLNGVVSAKILLLLGPYN